MWHRLKLLVRHLSLTPHYQLMALLICLGYFGTEANRFMTIGPFTPLSEPEFGWRAPRAKREHCTSIKGLRKWKERGRLQEVDAVYLNRASFQSDADSAEEVSEETIETELIEWLRQTPQLEFLILQDLPLNAAMLEQVARCNKLQWLALLDDELTPEILEPLRGHQELSVLDLSGSRFDGALAALGQVPDLKTVFLTQSDSITDAQLESLLEIPQLQILNLNSWYAADQTAGDSGITDAGIAALARHPRLREISVPVFENNDDKNLAPRIKAASPKCDVTPLNYPLWHAYRAFYLGMLEFILLTNVTGSLVGERLNSQSALLPHQGKISIAAHLILVAVIIAIASLAMWCWNIEPGMTCVLQSLTVLISAVGCLTLTLRYLHPQLMVAVMVLTGLVLMVAVSVIVGDVSGMRFLWGEIEYEFAVLNGITLAIVSVVFYLLRGLPQRVEELFPNVNNSNSASTDSFPLTPPTPVRQGWSLKFDQWLFERTSARKHETGFWSQLKHYRRGTRSRVLDLLIAFSFLPCILVVAIAAVVLRIGIEPIREVGLHELWSRLQTDDSPQLPMLVLCLWGMGTCCWMAQRSQEWTQRRKICEGELLRPMSSRRLFDLTMASVALDVTIAWTLCLIPAELTLLALGAHDWVRLLQDLVISASAGCAITMLATWGNYQKCRCGLSSTSCFSSYQYSLRRQFGCARRPTRRAPSSWARPISPSSRPIAIGKPIANTNHSSSRDDNISVPSSLVPLVPKLCLGTHHREALASRVECHAAVS